MIDPRAGSADKHAIVGKVAAMSLRHPLTRRQSFVACAGSALLLAVGFGTPAAHAEGAYPDKPVTFVNTFPPGGPSDILARSIAASLDTALKQRFIVENRPGAAGNIGAAYVANSRPDGYTVMFGIGTTFTVNPYIYKKMPFKPGDLKPVMILASSGLLVGVNPKTGLKTMDELVKAAKSKNLNFSSGGNGSPGQLEISIFDEVTKSKLNHIPYKGNSPAVAAILSGEVDGGVLATPGMIPYVKDGKITALAVTSPQRSKLAPTVPTVAEAGYKDLQQDVLYVAMVPAATPDAVVQTLAHAFADAMKRPEVQKHMNLLDIQPNGATGADAARILKDASERYGRIIKDTGMKVE
ncbi:MAG: BUG/TctC family periplasmic protein [Burkholderiaceae bacterium]|jgi:tripartite-type tricarboxylate transporter receptor subunit TctC|nr:MAG: BUG/TctC family periplasmic protein [Burkholderiaceae bacterium]